MRTTLLIAALLTGTVSAAAQSTKPARLNEDYTWNTAAATPRPLHYRPAGNGAETTDGTARFNRALYGAHTGFRLECSDMPEFGLYLPRMGGNLRIDIPHEHCTARYEAGRMIYRLDERVEIEAQVLRSEDAALRRRTNAKAASAWTNPTASISSPPTAQATSTPSTAAPPKWNTAAKRARNCG